MTAVAARWATLYNQTPLCDVPRHFAGVNVSPYLVRYLAQVLKLCPEEGRTLETGIGSGYGAIWLSRRGVCAGGIDSSPQIVERAKAVNNILGGSASFRVGNLFELYDAAPGARYDVIHHQGVLEHFTVPAIHAALAQQVALAARVVFSVPSVYYPFEPEFGDERLMPIEEWQRILAPFDVTDLAYYGDPKLGGKEHILGVLRGRKPDAKLCKLMRVPPSPYPQGISAIVHTRNEAKNIAACLEALAGQVEEIIVCDMESTDETVEIARKYTANIIAHPAIPNFDRARNVSAMRAAFSHVLYIDADERVPPGLVPAVRRIIEEQGAAFDAMLIPFRHYFCGHWMQCLYPGYTAPRLFKNGTFYFNARPHSGAVVDGRIVSFPADDPELALAHFSFDDLRHYVQKLNDYTDSEAANMGRDGLPFHWQNAVRHWVQDMTDYYDTGQARKDGVHGLNWTFGSGFYRYLQHAKLFELRERAGHVRPQERAVPGSVAELLRFALAVTEERPPAATPDIPLAHCDAEPAATVAARSGSRPATHVVWTGPLWDPSGYGEESRNFVLALEEAGGPVTAQTIPWSNDRVELSSREADRIAAMEQRPAPRGFVQIVQNFAPGFFRHPEAGIVIGRTMFETDRLPEDWVQACNRMDYVWVPSEFNRRTFADAGVEPQRLVVMPGCLDFEAWAESPVGTAAPGGPAAGAPFTFLSIFDWTLHKGWDVLLRGFLEGFAGREDVRLVLKVWSTMGYTADAIRAQAAAYCRSALARDLLADQRLAFLTERLSAADLGALYDSADAYVMPSRGEGWGRPYMEAMARGVPVIGTAWSGNTAFMAPENSYMIECEIVPVPEAGWKEIPTYKRHRWAEPSVEHLKSLMLRVAEQPDEAREVATRGRFHVTANFSRAAVGKLMTAELARIAGR